MPKKEGPGANRDFRIEGEKESGARVRGSEAAEECPPLAVAPHQLTIKKL